MNPSEKLAAISGNSRKTPVRKPSKILVPFAEARHWRAGGDFLLQQKMDGCFAPLDADGWRIVGERMRDGRFVAFDCLVAAGEDITRRSTRERWAALNQWFSTRQNAGFQDFKIELVPTGLGGEWVEHILATGGEGVCAKHLDAPYGEMFVCKRVQVFYCRVIGKDDSTGSVELERFVFDSGFDVQGSTVQGFAGLEARAAGRMPLRGNKFEMVRIGSVLKVEAFGLTEKGLLREARPDKDAPGSWLVKF